MPEKERVARPRRGGRASWRAAAAAITTSLLAAGAHASAEMAPAGGATLRFDRAVYAAPGCASLTLLAPRLAGGRGAPSIELAIVRGSQRVRGAPVSVAELPDSPGRFASPACVPLDVRPGDQLAAVALDGTKAPIAIALASVGGATGMGRVTAAVDPSLRETTSRRLRLGAVAAAPREPVRFVLGRVILREDADGELAAFLARRRGRLLSTHVTGGRGGAPEDVPVAYHLVEVDPATADAGGLGALLERFSAAEGALRFSSREALALLALVVEERASGRVVELDLALEPFGVPVSNEGAGADFLKRAWFDPMSTTTVGSGQQWMRLGEGVALAQIVAKKLDPVSVAIVDHGFAQPSDYAPAAVPIGLGLDYGAVFASIPQCALDDFGTADCSSGSAGGAVADCDGNEASCFWHGTAVFSAAAAVMNNLFGAAGTGGPPVRPLLLRVEEVSWSVGSAISEAMHPPSGPVPAAINLSLGVSCNLFELLDLCDPVTNAALTGVSCTLLLIAFPQLLLSVSCPALLALAAITSGDTFLAVQIDDAFQGGAVIVAGAGNDDESVDDLGVIPCVDDHVYCVSGAIANPAVSGILRGTSRHGPSVDLWAPIVIPVTPLPGGSGGLFGGTSGSAPLVSGAIALARAIAPGLTAQEAVDLVARSACASTQSNRSDGSTCQASTDAKIDAKGFLDLLEVVRQARFEAGLPKLDRCDGGFDEDERGGVGDGAAQAIPMQSLDQRIQAKTGHKGNRGMSIHGLSAGGTGVDEDWYDIRFTPDPGAPTLAFLVEARVKVQDPTLGSLFVDLMRETASGPKPVTTFQQIVSQAGDAITWAYLRTDTHYFARVSARNRMESNCYRELELTVIRSSSILPREDD